MLNPTATAFIAIFALEIAVIIIRNVFTIFIFWSLRLRLKRTCFLVINFAVANLLVGITEGVALGIHKSLRTEMHPKGTQSPSFASCTSLMFFALVSLERVYAVLRPLRHRVTRMQAYVFSIVTVWGARLCIAGLSLLSVYHAKVDILYAIVASDVLLLISLIIICASYLSTRSRLNHRTPNLQLSHKRSLKHNVGLSKLLYIEVAVSLILWLPAFVVYTIKILCWKCFCTISLWLVNVLSLANFMVNPFVYSFRMQIFKNTLKKHWKKQGEQVELRPVSLQVRPLKVREEPQEFTGRL